MESLVMNLYFQGIDLHMGIVRSTYCLIHSRRENMKDMLFSRYIAKNYMGNSLSDRELRVLKTGDVDALVATFVKMRNERYVQQLQCILKNFKIYLKDSVILNRITVSEEYEGKF